MTINVLGTEYTIETRKISADAYLRDNRLAGYCAEEGKTIVIADVSDREYFPGLDESEQEIYCKKVLRHELIHAFLNESGLSDNSLVTQESWAKNEEMVDWLAIQAPKIYIAFKDVGAL